MDKKQQFFEIIGKVRAENFFTQHIDINKEVEAIFVPDPNNIGQVICVGNIPNKSNTHWLKCEYCNTKNDESEKSCSQCGAPLPLQNKG